MVHLVADINIDKSEIFWTMDLLCDSYYFC